MVDPVMNPTLITPLYYSLAQLLVPGTPQRGGGGRERIAFISLDVFTNIKSNWFAKRTASQLYSTVQ